MRAVLECQRPEEREAQRRVHLVGVRSGEHRFRTGRGLGHQAGTQARLDHLRRHQVRVAMSVRQQRLDAADELDGDRAAPVPTPPVPPRAAR